MGENNRTRGNNRIRAKNIANVTPIWIFLM